MWKAFQFLFILILAAGAERVGAEEPVYSKVTTYDLATLVRGGCPDDTRCCLFETRELISSSDVYDDYDLETKIGHLKGTGQIDTLAGRIVIHPGKVRVLFNHGDWKKGDVIGLYNEMKPREASRLGDAIHTVMENAPFLFQSKSCEPPSASCWGELLSKPKIRWSIEVKMPDGSTGWIDASHLKPWDC